MRADAEVWSGYPSAAPASRLIRSSSASSTGARPGSAPGVAVRASAAAAPRPATIAAAEEPMPADMGSVLRQLSRSP